MSDTKCAYIGCERPSHRFWRLCDEHGPEYGDIVQRFVQASTPHLTTDTTNRGYDLKRAIEVAPQVGRDAWAVQTRVAPKPHHGCTYCGGDGRVTALDMTAGSVETNCPYSRCATCQKWVYPRCLACTKKPPTLREWLGDRVGELGRWADVLREQPVPAGWIERWDWKQYDGRWSLYTWARGGSLWTGFERFRAIACVTRDDGWLECLQMALFTRHPDVKPEPKAAAFPWDPYPDPY